MSRHRSRSLAILALGSLALAACAQVGEPGVDIQALQANVAFGLEIPEEDGAALSAASGVPDQVDEDPFDDGSVLVPFENTLPERFQNIPFRPSSGPDIECPTAPIGASPSSAAAEEVTTTPEPGLYDFKRSIELARKAGDVEYSFNVEGFERRALGDVEETAGAPGDGLIFTYSTARPDGFGFVLEERFRVTTEPISRGANPNVDPRGTVEGQEEYARDNDVPLDLPDDAVNQVPNDTSVRTGQPDRGLVLTEVRMLDSNSTQQGSFAPSPPPLLLPLPVVPGDEWSTTSVDPSNGQTMVVNGAVFERETVDVCGTLIDAWKAELEVTIATGEGSSTQTRELLVSTDRGAVIVGERLHEEGTTAEGSYTLDAEWSLADLDPEGAAVESGGDQ